MSGSKAFVREVSALYFQDTFNPYRDRCEVFDYSRSPIARKALLLAILEKACLDGVDSLWVGRDLGYRGGRRTGLALTDQIHVDAHLRRWSVAPTKELVVKGSAQAERTASVVWQMLSQIKESVFLWNVFPLHPYEAGDQFTNRAHTSKERDVGEEVLRELITLLQPRRIVAIGKDAAVSAARCSDSHCVVAVRHPSYGGLRDFENGLRSAYQLV